MNCNIEPRKKKQHGVHFSVYFGLYFNVKPWLKLVYEEVTVNDQTCQKWFANIFTGDYSLNDAL